MVESIIQADINLRPLFGFIPMPKTHNLFYFRSSPWHIGKHMTPILSNEHVIFDADAPYLSLLVQHLHIEEALLVFPLQGFLDELIGELDAWFHRHDHVHAQLVFPSQSLLSYVMHVQPQLVSQLVAHEDRVDVLTEERVHVTLQYLQFDKVFEQCAAGHVVHLVKIHSRTQGVLYAYDSVPYSFVKIFLFRREFAIRREGDGDVGCVSVLLTAHVEQPQFVV